MAEAADPKTQPYCSTQLDLKGLFDLFLGNDGVLSHDAVLALVLPGISQEPAAF